MLRNLDIIIYGATGFTGKHAIPILSKLAKGSNPNLTWGIAGRSEEKLKDVLSGLESQLETPLEKIPIIIADIKDEESLKAMARQARIIINCVGPYRFFGEPVVKACVEEGTHHVDVSGEPQYIEAMALKYHKQAEEKGIYIISACGFDSIPSDLGVVFLQKEFNGTVNSAETYLKTWTEDPSIPGSSANYGTWESAVYGLAHAKELGGLRRKLYPTRLPQFNPKLTAKSIPHQSKIVEGWTIPFLGSDKSIIRRSQRLFYEENKKRPVQIETYMTVPNIIHLIGFIIFGSIFGILARFSFGRALLLKYPDFFSYGLFSKKPPSEEKLNSSWFSITIYGKGWKESLSNADDVYTNPPDKAMTVKIQGPNPAYGSTNICLVLAAIKVINETNKLPGKGGVIPPGYAFAATSLIEDLNSNGVTFEVLAEKNLTEKSKL